MSATFLKTLSLSVSETSSTLYNESFSQGIFPDHMKHVIVTSISKGGSKRDMDQYPSFLGKLMLTRLLDYLDKSNIIYKH